MNDTTSTPPPIGHNAQANLGEMLAEQYGGLLDRVSAMIERLEATPQTVDDDEASGRCSDVYKDADGLLKEIEGSRVAEKAPFLEGGRKVQSFFTRISETLEKAAAPVHARATAYMVRKRNEADRLAREEAARKRAEADRLAREAREAEQRRVEAELAADRARKASNEQAARDAAAAHAALADRLRDQAAQSAADAAAADERLDESSASKARTRGAASVATLQQVMAFEVLDYEKIPLEILRPYLAREAIDQAIKALGVVQKRACLVGDGLTMIPGVRFYMRDKGHIR